MANKLAEMRKRSEQRANATPSHTPANPKPLHPKPITPSWNENGSGNASSPTNPKPLPPKKVSLPGSAVQQKIREAQEKAKLQNATSPPVSLIKQSFDTI